MLYMSKLLSKSSSRWLMVIAVIVCDFICICLKELDVSWDEMRIMERGRSLSSFSWMGYVMYQFGEAGERRVLG
jgi:hypothetical protein